jgi:hypothetical protein
MKKILFVSALFISSVALKAQTVDEVIAKHVDAVGGADNWRKVTSVKSEGSLEVQGAKVNLTTSVIAGKGARQDVNVMGMVGYYLVTPTAGWKLEPWNGVTSPEAMTADELKERAAELDPQGEFIDMAQKGHKAELTVSK